MTYKYYLWLAYIAEKEAVYAQLGALAVSVALAFFGVHLLAWRGVIRPATAARLNEVYLWLFVLAFWFGAAYAFVLNGGQS